MDSIFETFLKSTFPKCRSTALAVGVEMATEPNIAFLLVKYPEQFLSNKFLRTNITVKYIKGNWVY